MDHQPQKTHSYAPAQSPCCSTPLKHLQHTRTYASTISTRVRSRGRLRRQTRFQPMFTTSCTNDCNKQTTVQVSRVCSRAGFTESPMSRSQTRRGVRFLDACVCAWRSTHWHMHSFSDAASQHTSGQPRNGIAAKFTGPMAALLSICHQEQRREK
jgi:hypothetical protein